MYPQGYTTGDEDDTADYLDGRGKPTYVYPPDRDGLTNIKQTTRFKN